MDPGLRLLGEGLRSHDPEIQLNAFKESPSGRP
jgi:hypothetical protein